MPRVARQAVGGLCYHVINRGNGRATVFHKEADYQAFVSLMAAACTRRPMRVLAFCLMPNHFHFVLWPEHDGDLSRWMQWFMTTHVRRYHGHHGSSGHVWQGRYKSFPVQDDAHLFTVLRYVERNPLRAGLVKHAEDWRWSSLAYRRQGAATALLHPPPLPLPRDWRRRVNQAESDAELAALRRSVVRGAPWGSASWVERTARDLGLEATLRPRGRPRVEKKGTVPFI